MTIAHLQLFTSIIDHVSPVQIRCPTGTAAIYNNIHFQVPVHKYYKISMVIDSCINCYQAITYHLEV